MCEMCKRKLIYEGLSNRKSTLYEGYFKIKICSDNFIIIFDNCNIASYSKYHYKIYEHNNIVTIKKLGNGGLKMKEDIINKYYVGDEDNIILDKEGLVWDYESYIVLIYEYENYYYVCNCIYEDIVIDKNEYKLVIKENLYLLKRYNMSVNEINNSLNELKELNYIEDYIFTRGDDFIVINIKMITENGEQDIKTFSVLTDNYSIETIKNYIENVRRRK